MSRFTDARVPAHGVHALLEPDALLRRCLDVEVALAEAEAETGVIPAAAAAAIAAAPPRVDLERVHAGIARSSHPLMALVVELAEAAGDPHGGWVHWGATTQNVTQTASVLALRDARHALLALLADVLAAGAGLAETHADTVMAGRTHGQQAVPITFGLKVAAWLDALGRDRERLEQLAPRLEVAMIGGAAGTFAALGERGPAVQAALARRLGLGSMPVPSRAIADPFAELVCALGLLAATAGTIAGEIFTLMGTELEEVAEPQPAGVIGSSTMPQKRNPQLCQDVVTISAQVRALVPLALEAMLHSHESDGARTAMMDDALARSCGLAADALVRLHVILAGLEVDAARMREHLELTGGLIAAEAVMLALGERIGRQRAHDVVHHAAQATREGDRPAFAAALAADPRVTDHLEADELAALLDPANHAGLAGTVAREAATRARAQAAGTPA